MSEEKKEMTPLEVIKLVNTGILVWDSVGELVQEALEKGTPVSLDQVRAAAEESETSLDELEEAIAGMGKPQ